MRRAFRVLVVAAALALASCAPGNNPSLGTPADSGVVAGFWRGLWHGAIAPITFVVSLFSDHVHVYEVHNSGGWYDLGFLLGVSGPHGGGYAARQRSRRKVVVVAS